MFSLSIVIRFYVLEYSGRCNASSSVPFTVHQLDFQRVEKTLHRRIIITIGFASHAAAQPVVLDQSLISFRTILAAAIGMYDRARGKVAPEQCHGECIANQFLRHSRAH